VLQGVNFLIVKINDSPIDFGFLMAQSEQELKFIFCSSVDVRINSSLMNSGRFRMEVTLA
jgi:hypothetical protein